MAIETLDAEVSNLGKQFYQQGMSELGKIVYGEEEARTAMLVGAVGASAILLAGVPGGAKSTLSRNFYRIFEDVESSDIAIVPPASDLQPIQLVGGSMDTTKKVHRNGDSYEETVTVTVDPIVRPDTKIIWLDELSRINPEAVNQLLGAPEERELKTTAGIVPLNELLFMVSTMNASETRQATFPITAAFASRHSAGAIMGQDISPADKAKLADGHIPNPQEVVPFTNTEQVLKLRKAVGIMALGAPNAERVVELVENTEEYLLNEHGIEEAGRMNVQVGKTAKILALFEGGDIKEKHLNQATRFALAARMGARVSKRQSVQALNEAYRHVISL